LLVVGCSNPKPPPPSEQNSASGLPYGSGFVGSISSKRVIVFVHGIYGSPRETWRAENGAFWPTLLRNDQTVPGYDVFVASYPSPLFDNRMSVSETAELLNTELIAAEIVGNKSRYKDIVFVCHSLGGLVVDQMLLDHHETASRVRLIYFYATPMYGSWVANFGSVFSKDALLRDLFSGDGTQYSASQASSWRSAGFNGIHRFCAYEKQPTLNGIVVVSEVSATYLCDPEEAIHAVADANHLTIVKPQSESSFSYILLKQALNKLWPDESQTQNETAKSNSYVPPETVVPEKQNSKGMTTFSKPVCTFYGEAAQGMPAWHKSEVCVIPDVDKLDQSYKSSGFVCCGGGAQSKVTDATIPPGIEIQTRGGVYWSIPDVHLDGSNLYVSTYCGPTAAPGPGCNVAATIYAHYKE
jgi:hypothetical protein